MSAVVALRFIDDASGVTVDLSGPDGKPRNYVPGTPTLRTRSTSTVKVDGAEQQAADYDNVTETVTAIMTGGTSAIRTAINKLEQLFDQARRYQEPGIQPVYAKVRPDSGESYFRSQVLAGRVLWDSQALSWMWRNGQITVQIIYTRRYFWEQDSESEIPLLLAGEAGAGTTGGRTITNKDTGSSENLIQINKSQLATNIRQPMRLLITNLVATTVAKIYLSQDFYDLGNAVVYEGESATPLSNQTDANSSGGHFNRATWSGTSETDLLTWTIAGALSGVAGRWLRVMARFANTFAYTDLYARVKVVMNGVTVYQSNKKLLSASVILQEIASIPMPPALAFLSTLADASLVLEVTRVAGGSCTLDVDYLALMPMDGWRKFIPLSSGIGQNAVVVDDGIGGNVYSISSGGKKIPDWKADGDLLQLETTIAYGTGMQNLRFLWSRSDGSCPISDTMSIRAYYRPRRLTL